MQETQETCVQSLGQKDSLEKGMATHSSILGKSHIQRSLAGYSPWGRKESDTTEHAASSVTILKNKREIHEQGQNYIHIY